MRKVLLFVSALTLVIAPLAATSSASASSTKYKITISAGPQDIDVSRNHADDKVTIHGTVSGGPVKGKTVHLYRYNQHGPDHGQVSLGTVKLPSSGKYSKTDHPPLGGRWIYTATKLGSGKLKGATATHHLDAYQWDFASVFFHDGQPGVTKNPKVAGKYETSPGTGDHGYGNAFAIDGGNTLTFATAGNRCKGVTYHIAISNSSTAPAGSQYEYDVMKGDTELYHHTMAKGDDPQEPTQAERKSFGSMSGDGPFQIRIPGDASVRFLVGNPKIACTYPDPTNID